MGLEVQKGCCAECIDLCRVNCISTCILVTLCLSMYSWTFKRVALHSSLQPAGPWDASDQTLQLQQQQQLSCTQPGLLLHCPDAPFTSPKPCAVVNSTPPPRLLLLTALLLLFQGDVDEMIAAEVGGLFMPHGESHTVMN